MNRSYATYLPVINVTKVTYQPEHLNLYQPTYVCQLPSLHETESTITCARSMKSYDQVCDGLRHCHIHQLNFTQMWSCDLKCINIIMSNSPDVHYNVSKGDLPIPTDNQGECVMKTPTTKSAPLTENPIITLITIFSYTTAPTDKPSISRLSFLSCSAYGRAIHVTSTLLSGSAYG